MLYLPHYCFTFDDSEFHIALLVLAMQSPNMEYVYCTSDDIMAIINSDSRKEKTTINKILQEFADQKIGNVYLISKKRFWRSADEHYARIDFADIQKIMKSNCKNSKTLIKYYCWLMKSVNNETNIGVQPINYFATVMNCDRKSIMRMNEQLEKLGVIYIRHSSTLKQGTEMAETNVYGSPKYKAAINETADRKFRINCMNARELGTKITWLRRGKQYTLEEIQEMYDYAVYHNTQVMLKKKEGNLIDMGIFDTYDIKHNEDYELFA